MREHFFCNYCENYRSNDDRLLMTRFPMCNGCYMTKLYGTVLRTRKHFTFLETDLIDRIVETEPYSYISLKVKALAIERVAEERMKTT